MARSEPAVRPTLRRTWRSALIHREPGLRPRPIELLRWWFVTMCVLCRRHLLAGERYRHWESAERVGARVVCGLCEPDARRASWARLSPAPERESADGLRWNVRLVA